MSDANDLASVLQRLESLEIKASFTEDLLDQLNMTIYRQQELIDRAYALATERFAPRAARHDREASFPFEDYADLQQAGLLGLCVPEQHGGLGADFETYCLVSEQIARGNASTALTYNMHALTMLMMGHFLKDLDLPPEARARHEALSARLGEVAQRFDTQSLEGIRARARLERPTPQHRRAGRRHRLGGLEQLVARLDRTRSGHNGQ